MRTSEHPDQPLPCPGEKCAEEGKESAWDRSSSLTDPLADDDDDEHDYEEVVENFWKTL